MIGTPARDAIALSRSMSATRPYRWTGRLALEFVREALDLGTEDETLTVADAGDGRQDLLPERRVLCVEVQQRDAGPSRTGLTHGAR